MVIFGASETPTSETLRHFGVLHYDAPCPEDRNIDTCQSHISRADHFHRRKWYIAQRKAPA